MPIDFNQPPYFDDYYAPDKNGKTPLDKGYYKILFQPSVAIQTRELNQLQTMIQTQIEKFGSHIFREGSLVLGGQFDYQKDVKYVKLNASAINNFENIDFNNFIGKEIRGVNSNLKAFVLATEFDNIENVQVFIIRYLNSNIIGNEETKSFLPLEEIEIVGTNFTFPVVDEPQIPTGNSSIFSIEEGVIFIKGYFVKFLRQTVIVEKYSSTPTKSIGFVVDRPLIGTFETDETLFDNARGFFNFTAPGADRLILSMKLISTDNPENFADQDFALIAKIENGFIEDSKQRSSYAEIYNEIAKRTFDESGDYYVRGLNIRTREALDVNNNEGLDINGDSNKISVDVEPGLAYVKGFEINNLVTKHILVDKGIDSQFVNNSIINARTGGFIIADEIQGFLPFDQGIEVELFDAFQNRISNSIPITNFPIGSKIGKARIKTILYNSGKLGEPEGSLRVYLFDIKMSSPSIISDAKSIVLKVGNENKFFADIKTGLSNNIENTLIYPIGTSNTKTIRSQSNQFETDMAFSFYTSSVSLIPANENFVNVISSSLLNYSITGNDPLSEIESRTIFLVDSDTGEYYDLTEAQIFITSNSNFTINFGNSFTTIPTTRNVIAIYKARETDFFETKKELISNVVVKIDYSSINAPSTSSSPINLGFPDVWKIKEVRKKSDGDFENENDGIDVTHFFKLDNGQRDNFYDHARLIPLNENIIDPQTDQLLIKLDVFRANNHSYFSVDSYPVNDSPEPNSNNSIFTYEIPKYVSSSGTVFNLKDSLDFRPYKRADSNYTTSLTLATTNPTDTNVFILNDRESKLLIPVPSSPITIDYSYYLARRDILTLDKDGNFLSVKGVPSLSPISPSISENTMAIANIYIPPYPSISQTLSRIINWKDEFVTHQRVANKRYTMRDIGVLKSRIENLEYYNALNLLEKNTNDLTILDGNGNNRFKNGFFVDGFLDHSLGDTDNPDYNIAVDRIEQVIRPTFKLDSFQYELVSDENIKESGSLIHLPIVSEEILIDQPRVTTRRNVEQSVYRFVGQIDLTPDNDVWIDETTIDRELEFGSDIDLEKGITTEWGSWERHVIGYDAYNRVFGDRTGKIGSTNTLLGTFNSFAAASSHIAKFGTRADFIQGRGVVATVSEDRRSGIQTSVSYEKETQEIGNLVTDVTLIPYIRPQAIEFYARGLKPNTRHWLFFDGEEMTALNLVEQYVDIDNPVEFTGSNIIRTDQFGEIRGVLFLPVEGKRFRVGSREVKILDNPTGSFDDITSLAKDYFLASGLNVQKQNTILSTKTLPIVKEERVFETASRRIIDTSVIGPSCIAYTFRVDVPPENEGTFLTSVDLFFQELHPELGFRVQIRELNSAGNITQNVLPYSEVWVSRKIPNGNGSSRIDNPIIKISENGSEATNIRFKAPVFVYNDTSYAIVISAENINPDTYLWISRLGETDLLTGQPVTSRPLTGAVFTTNNGVNWDIVPQADLKIKLYRAKFETGTVSKVGLLKNKGYEFFKVKNISGDFKKVGEEIKGSERLLYSNLTNSGSVSGGQIIVGQNSGTEGKITSIQGANIFTDGFGFEPGENVQIFDQGNLTTPISSATITQVFSGKGVLKKYYNGFDLELSNTNGQFFEGAKLKGEISQNFATIDSIESFSYDSTTLKPDFLNFNKTSISFEKRGRRKGSNNIFTNYQEGFVDNTSEFEEELHILSRSNEIKITGPEKYSTDVRVSMKSETEYLSPIVDSSRAHSVYIHNIVNDDDTGEDEAFGGNLKNKYISKTVTLDDGQDAEDLIVFLTAYRPVNSDIKVWIKIRNNEDPTLISERPWIEMVPDNSEFSSPENKFDFRSYRFLPPPSIINNNDIIEYNGLFRGFKQFSLKIGILTNNSSIIPKVADLRAIALQK